MKQVETPNFFNAKNLLMEGFRVLFFIVAPLVVGYFLINHSLTLTGNTGFEHFNSFWIGFIISVVGLSIYGFTSRNSYAPIVSMFALGLLGSFQKIVLSSYGPLYHDEYAHLRTAEDIAETGVVTGFNSIVNAAPLFDFMHHLTVLLSKIFGLEVWTAGVWLIILVHIFTPFLVWNLVRVAGFSSKAGMFAGLLYSSNSNWMFFHSQYGYESLGLPLVLVVLTVVLHVFKTWDWVSVETKSWVFLLSGLMFVLSNTHHLSTVFILMMLTVFFLTNVWFFVRGHMNKVSPSFVVLGAATIGSVKNIAENLSFIYEYLTAPANTGWSQLLDLLQNLLFAGSEKETASRTLFEGGALPVYEVFASFGAVIILGLIVLYSLVAVVPTYRVRFKYSTEHLTREVVTLMVYGGLYVISVFLILTPGGAEGARRSWGYLFIGLALTVAWAWDNHIHKMVPLQNIIALLIIPVLYVGGTAAGLNGSYRFPFNNVPDNVISDITASSFENKQLGEWFADNIEPETWVLADRYTKLQIASQGKANVLPAYSNFPYWEIYFNPANIDMATLGDITVSLYAADVKHVIVDTRMATHVPELGFWFARSENNTEDSYTVETVDTESLNQMGEIFFLKENTRVGVYIIYDVVFPEGFIKILPDRLPPLNVKKPKDVFKFLEETTRADVDISVIVGG